MSGIQYMIIGSILLIMSVAGFALTEWGLAEKKRKIREQTYQIYE